jgi:hypothetical protein
MLINTLHFTVSTLFQLDQNGRRIELMNEVIRTARLHQLTTIVSQVPVLGSVVKPIGHFFYSRLISTSKGQKKNADGLTSHALFDDEIGLSSDLNSSSAIKIAGRILDIRRDSVAMESGREFLEEWLPKLAVANTCFIFFNGYFVVVAIINLVFKRTRNDDHDKNIVFAVAFLKDRFTIVLPVLPLKPSITFRFEYKKRWFIIPILYLFAQFLGVEFLLMGIYGLYRKVSFFTLQAACLNHTFGNFIKDESMDEVVKLVKLYLNHGSAGSTAAQYIKKATSISGYGAAAYSFGKKLFQGSSPTTPNLMQFGTTSTIPVVDSPPPSPVGPSAPGMDVLASPGDSVPAQGEILPPRSPFGDPSDFTDT